MVTFVHLTHEKHGLISSGQSDQLPAIKWKLVILISFCALYFAKKSMSYVVLKAARTYCWCIVAAFLSTFLNITLLSNKFDLCLEEETDEYGAETVDLHFEGFLLCDYQSVIEYLYVSSFILIVALWNLREKMFLPITKNFFLNCAVWKSWLSLPLFWPFTILMKK